MQSRTMFLIFLPAVWLCCQNTEAMDWWPVSFSDVATGDERPLQLWNAVMNNDIKQVRSLFDDGLQPDVRNIHGFTALHHLILCADNSACAKPATCAMLQYLIQRGVPVDARSDGGVTPLHCAAAMDRNDMARLLLADGADVETQTIYGHTPIHYAVFNRSLAMVRELLAAGAARDICDTDGRTPQYYAITAGLDDDLIRQLRPGDAPDPFEDASLFMRGLDI